MKDFIQRLKPTPLGILFILLALSLQAVFFSSSTTTFSSAATDPDKSAFAFGLGSPVTAITVDGKTSYQIRGAILALNLAATYVGAILVATALARITRLRRPAMAYGLLAAVMVVVTFLASIGISRVVWGYFISRPALLSEIRDIGQVKSIVPFKTESIDFGKRAIVPDDSYSISNYIASAKTDPYYCLSARILIELGRRNLLPAAPSTTLAGLPELYPLIQNSGTLANSTKGYDSSAELNGVVVDAIDKSGNRIVFLGLTGGSLSNDHHPYYEMLFRGQKSAPELSFVRGQRFFYDVAGMEGFEWYAIWLVLSVPGIVAGFVIYTIGRIIWKKKPDAV